MASEIILRKGEVIDYQTIIEEVVGPFLAINMNYDANYDKKKVIGGKEVSDEYRAYFIGDADYEIIVRKKRR